MNKQIKELIARTNLRDFLAPNQRPRAKDLEEFAELIIADCIEQCRLISMTHYAKAQADSHEITKFQEDGTAIIEIGEGPCPTSYSAYMATIKCRVKIKEHFGLDQVNPFEKDGDYDPTI